MTKLPNEKPAADSDSKLLSNQTSEDSQFDEIIEKIGNDGYFQKRFNFIFNFTLIALMTMPYLNLVLAMSIPEHHCHVPGREKTNFSLNEWHLRTLPRQIHSESGLEITSSCMMKNGSNEIDCQHGWDYDQKWFKLTVPTMQNWVCEKELYVTNTFVASRIGEIIGVFTFGQLGDKIGRKPVFFIALTLLLFGRSLLVVTSHVYHWFLVVVVLGSSSNVAVFQTPIVIGMEVSADSKRAHIAFMQCVGWVIGNCTLPLIAWVVGDWRWMILATTIPIIVAFPLYKIMPESPRWLATQGRTKAAVRSLQYIADINKAQLPKDTIDVLEKIAAKKEKTYGYPSLFFHKRLAKNTLMIVSCWVVCGLSYYSLVLNVSNMAGNPFMNFFWQSLVELPGYVIGRYLTNSIGRRWTHTGSYLISIMLCAAVILSHGMSPWVTTTFVTCVKFSFTVSFYIVWLQAMEVYPTCLRQTGTSIGGLASNIFGILGPYVVYLGSTVDSRLPYVILLGLAVIGAACSCMLPETLNKKLPETMEDAKNFGKNQKFWSFNKEQSKY